MGVGKRREVLRPGFAGLLEGGEGEGLHARFIPQGLHMQTPVHSSLPVPPGPALSLDTKSRACPFTGVRRPLPLSRPEPHSFHITHSVAALVACQDVQVTGGRGVVRGGALENDVSVGP